MSTEDAVYTIAHDEGIDIARFLSSDDVSRVRQLVSSLSRTDTAVAAPAKASRGRPPARAVVVTMPSVGVSSLPGMTASHAQEAKEMAAKVYPILYVFENSVRDLITRVLKAALGDDWWELAVSSQVRSKAASRQANEDDNPWHGKRGAAPIFYVDLPDLAKIVKGGKAWPHFEALGLFPRQSWFEEIVSDMNVSRRVVAHMNPLAKDDIKNIEAAFRKWSRQLEARKDRIP